MAEIPKAYNPSEIEPQWARKWVEDRLYQADANSTKPMFSLVIPPPNVTGSLHMGHMLEHTEIDIDRKSTRLNSSHIQKSRMPSSA